MGVRMRVVIYALDLSGSMDNPDIDGVVKRDKVYKAIKDLEEWLKSLDESSEEELLDRFEFTYMALAYFGEEGFDSSNDYLFDLAGMGKLVKLADIRNALIKGANLVNKDVFDSKGHNGTDIGQLIRAVKSVVERVKTMTTQEGANDIAYYLVVLGDGCFNLYENQPLDPNKIYDVIADIGNKLNVILSEPQGSARLRGKIFLIWGDPSGFEDERYICPWRACLLTSRMEEIPEAIKNTLEDLERQGVITRNDSFFNDPNLAIPNVPGNLLIRDFAVARLESLDKLSEALMSLTTRAADQR